MVRFPPEDRADTIHSLSELHLDPAGRQICTLFKIDRMVPFEDSQLDTLRKLRATYELLQGAAPSLHPVNPPLSQPGTQPTSFAGPSRQASRQ